MADTDQNGFAPCGQRSAPKPVAVHGSPPDRISVGCYRGCRCVPFQTISGLTTAHTWLFVRCSSIGDGKGGRSINVASTLA